MEDPNYFLISFNYPHATHGTSGPGFHISYFVDEVNESRLLTQAMRNTRAAFDKIEVDYRCSYAWPNGSLFYYLKTDLTFFELQLFLTAGLRGTRMTFELTSASPFEKSHKDWDVEYDEVTDMPLYKETLEEHFRFHPSDKGSAKLHLIKNLANMVLPNTFKTQWYRP